RPPRSTPFPYTTLFRSGGGVPGADEDVDVALVVRDAELRLLLRLPVFRGARLAEVTAEGDLLPERFVISAVEEGDPGDPGDLDRSEEHTSELQSLRHLV